MGKRRASRELALKFLYQNEFSTDDSETQVIEFCERADTDYEIAEFMEVLVDKILAQSKMIDIQLKKFSDHWTLERMSMIDRNILRLGICELLFEVSTPPKVVINEAVEIAKKFGSDDSPDFINGILDKVYKEKLNDFNTVPKK